MTASTILKDLKDLRSRVGAAAGLASAIAGSSGPGGAAGRAEGEGEIKEGTGPADFHRYDCDDDCDDVCSICGGCLKNYMDKTWCPACVQKIIEEETQSALTEDIKKKELAKTKAFEQKFDSIKIGKRFLQKTWDDYIPTCQQSEKIKNYCKNIANDFDRHLELGTNWIFVGGCGTGKNMLSALIAKDVVFKGKTALHTTAAKLIRKVRSSWSNKELDEIKIIDEFCCPDLLIIDEIGVQNGTNSEINILTEIINTRYEELRPTICISNLELKKLEGYLGERVLDRFQEGESKVLIFNWESWRRRRPS